MANGGFSSAMRLPGGPSADELEPVSIDLGKADTTKTVDAATGAESIEVGDGSVVINFNPKIDADGDDANDFFENLADRIEPSELMRIAEELLQGIEADNQSRAQWLATRARGIDLLGLKLQQPRSEVGSAPLEGMSTVSHPLLLEATLRFQSTARGELLPSGGPVKVRDDDDEGGDTDRDELAEAMEIDFNHFLTDTATEYYPDTDRMLFYVGFGGCGFKKVYTCPIRRRPVSESVDAKDLIVSDAVTDLRNAGRVTQRIMMRKSVLKRMQLVGAYREVSLHTPAPTILNAVDRKIADIQGIAPEARRQEDRERALYESYCEFDIKGFEHRDEDGALTGLPLPYRIALDEDSRQILAVHRNWDEEDDQCLAQGVYVKYPYVPGLGFYDIGLVHILGNSTIALTAAWREMLDAGMFASFPGGLMARQVARQETNEFRVAPGSFVPVETGGAPIQEVVMALPYRDVSPGLMSLTESITQIAQRVGGTAEMSVGEGSQEAPVGTTLALIEQATKVTDAVHKRIHAAQAEEFKLLKREFRKDPASLWRSNPKSKIKLVMGLGSEPDIDPGKLERFTAALNDVDLVPAADPNTPSEMHRLMKASALLQLMQMSQEIPDARLDPRKVIQHSLRTLRVSPNMLTPPPDPNAPPPMDPKVQAAMIQSQQSQDKVQIAQIQSADKARESATKEKVADIEMQRDILAHHTSRMEIEGEANNPANFANGGAVEQQKQAHEVTMAQHELHHTALEHQDAAAERNTREKLSQADILKQLIAHKTKELDIKKAEVEVKKAQAIASKPKAKPKAKAK